MNAVVSIPFKKRLLGSSQKAQTLHWLRCTYGRQFEEAIANAVWIVHFVSALAASPETWRQVAPAVVQAREAFEGMMLLGTSAPRTERPIPKRLTVQFKIGVALVSDSGKTFQWLLNTYGDKAVDEIIHAVWLVYFPATLGASSETMAQSQIQAERSRLAFELKMTTALIETNSDAMTLIANRLDRTLASSPKQAPFKELPPIVLPESETEPKSQAANDKDEPQEDFDDDYVPIEPDPDFN